MQRCLNGMMYFRLFFFLAIWIFCGRTEASSVRVTVKDGQGTLVSDAVVYAKSNNPVVSVEKKQPVIEQRDKQFVPYVTAIQVGTSVTFPNRDSVRHDVYSLSPAKDLNCRFTLAFRPNQSHSIRKGSSPLAVAFTTGWSLT